MALQLPFVGTCAVSRRPRGRRHNEVVIRALSDTLFDRGRTLTPLEGTEQQLFLLEPGNGLDRMIRYTAMLVLSAIIATGGVVLDSTATVIGAMIVAPLATPILGVGLGVTIASPAQVGRSAAIVGVSMAFVIVVGALMTMALPMAVDIDANTQTTGRISPGLIDLVVAIATGLVGAFAIARSDLAGVLPGVAIAISLVPPLAVVGVLVADAHWAEALGALLLFLSNGVAMVGAGALVFGIAGYGGHAADRRAVRRPILVIAGLAALVVAALTVVSLQTVGIAVQEARAEAAARTWLEGSGYRVTSVRSSHTDLIIEVVGRGALPDTAAFHREFRPVLWLDPHIDLRQLDGTFGSMPRPQ